MGQHADRNAQFEKIAELKQHSLEAGRPVISIDTKKKELLGNFYRDGVTDGIEPTVVNDHDFPSASSGKVIPHGICDLARNEASLHLNSSRDTSELACESIELWWREQGPPCRRVAGSLRWWRQQQCVAILVQRGFAGTIEPAGTENSHSHYLPYCSKYNPIEHRVFPHVTRACKGVPLETIETAKHYIEKTETTTGLNVVVRIIDKVYETGRKYAEDFKKMMTIEFDKHLPKWNYTAIPDTI